MNKITDFHLNFDFDNLLFLPEPNCYFRALPSLQQTNKLSPLKNKTKEKIQSQQPISTCHIGLPS